MFVATNGSNDVPVVPNLPGQIVRHAEVLYLDYFDAFMQRCQVTPGFAAITADLLPIIHASPSLQDVTVAIGALDASRRASVGSPSGKDAPRYVAFSSYGRAIATLKARLDSTEAVGSEDVLWGTFLLGLFEACLHRTVIVGSATNIST